MPDEITKQHFIFTGKLVKNGCAVVAILLNSDGYRKKDKSPFRAIDVWRSNSHGELFGVFDAIQFAGEMVNKMYDILLPEMRVAIGNALETGEDQDVEECEKWFTGIGRACAQMMWRDVP